jgi:hypothetical protein
MAPNRPFVVSPVLTAIAVGYRNPAHALIADRALPRVAVQQEVFKWTSFPLAEAFTLPETEVSRRGRPAQMEFTGTEETAATSDYGLDSDIPYTDIDAADRAREAGLGNVDPEKLAATQLSNIVELAREVRAAAVVQNAANFSAGRKITLAGNDQLSAFATSDPYGVIDTAMNGTLVYRPNTISMGRVVWNIIKRHPKLIMAVKGGLSEEGAITRREFAELFEIAEDRLLIGEGWLNTAKKGQPVNLQQVWGKSIQCTYIDPSKGSADDPTITWGFTAQLGTKIAGSGEDPHIGIKGGKFVRVGEQVKELVAAKDTGYQISAAVA